MKNFVVCTFAFVDDGYIHNRTKWFWNLSEAMEFAAERGAKGDAWCVTDTATGEMWRGID